MRRQSLGKAKVLATSRHGRVESLPQRLVTIVLWKVKFWEIELLVVKRIQQRSYSVNLRLKHVCELGKRSLLP